MNTSPVVLAAFVSALAANGGDLAWFVTARLEPASTSIADLPLRRFDSSLRLATVPAVSDVPSAGLGVEEIRRGEYAFDLSADFDANGTVERALVGVYLDKNGKTGRFLAILGQAGWLRTPVLHFERFEGEPKFSFLSWDGKQLVWHGCLHCDHYAIVHLSNRQVTLEFWEGQDDG